MRNSKFNLLAVAAISLATVNFAPVSAAHAADLPLKAVAPAPVAFTWTGVYLGIEGGWKESSDRWTTTCLGLLATLCSPSPTSFPLFPVGGNPFFVDASSPHTFKTNGARVGGYAGYNWQFGPWVVGLEADLAWSNNQTTVAGIVGCSAGGVNCGFRTSPPASIAADSTQVRTLEDGSFRGRAGFLATPDLLLYGTGGFAFQESEFTQTCQNNALSPWCTTFRTQTQNTGFLPGWTVGGGIEFRIWDHWLLRGEYRYSEFQDFRPSFFVRTADDTFNVIRIHTQIATAGIAYKF